MAVEQKKQKKKRKKKSEKENEANFKDDFHSIRFPGFISFR